jgi:hypothetical protein
MSLNFARPLPNPLHPRIAPDAFQWQVTHQAHAAVNLDGFVGDEGEGLGGFEFGHGHVHFGDSALVVFPCSFTRQEFGGFEFHRHVGEFEGDTLELADLLAELFTVHGVLQATCKRVAPNQELATSKPLWSAPSICDLWIRQSLNSRMLLG